MANLIFKDCNDPTTITCNALDDKLIINVESLNLCHSIIELDIYTAIAFRKHLAQQIARAKEYKEVQNG